jgi:glycosyltransferase involved in cell wall biosynthesis
LNSAASHYLIPAEPGRGRALALAALVHFLLLVFLWFGVSWQSDTPTEVEAEIWSPVAREAAPPPPPPVAKPIQEPPKPVAAVTPPTPPAPVIQPEPAQHKLAEPDIALEKEKKRKQEKEDAERLKKEKLAEKKALEEEQKNDGKFNVVFAGNVGIGQGIEVILEAAKILSDIDNIQFVIYGSGSRLEWLEEQKKQYNLKGIILKGRHPVESMPQLLSNANALLVTLSDEPIFAKTIPNKIQAYLAVGRPILACLNGEGARVVNEAKAGIAVPAGDSKRLSEAILNLYKLSEKEMTIYGKNGREYYEKNLLL